ncbi:transposase IS200 like protein [Desulfosporosinus acididurans]|uniref:Transposase IS200 like protein n=1 Tax=Desulfosporosinus acididurans TaxID=476652 RepID=A0A0J1FKC5_9FIRM|nr:transposase [Desulfosporosinus acididurans]KLU63915.1 transposase IS200 like protein [Desulfosporosinus acididurans]
MTRLQRRYSNSGCYHIMLRGNERKNIFLDDEDRQRFINIVNKKQTDNMLILYAYCLMDNHVHLALKDTNNDVSISLKGIATSYAMHFNKKYGRVGHVFQGRYRSEVIENDRSLLAVIRYIHQNPQKAFLVQRAEQYQWSSYQWYLDRNREGSTIVDVLYILKMFAEDQKDAINEFIKFSNENNKDTNPYLDDNEGNGTIRTIQDGKVYLHNYLNQNWSEMSLDMIKTEKNFRTSVIRNLRTNTNLSVVSIAKLLGINRGMVERVRS